MALVGADTLTATTVPGSSNGTMAATMSAGRALAAVEAEAVASAAGPGQGTEGPGPEALCLLIQEAARRLTLPPPVALAAMRIYHRFVVGPGGTDVDGSVGVVVQILCRLCLQLLS